MSLTIFRKRLFFLAVSVVSVLLLAAPTLVEYAVMLGLVTDEECRVSYRVEDERSLLVDLEVSAEVAREPGQCLVRVEAELRLPAAPKGVWVTAGLFEIQRLELQAHASLSRMELQAVVPAAASGQFHWVHNLITD